MATPIAQLKKLFLEFLNQGCNFDKVPASLKKPMLVKVFRTEPYFYVSDKENYLTGYFPKKAMKKLQKEHKLTVDDLKAKTLKVEKFRLELVTLGADEYSLVSYLGREVRLVIEEFSLSRPLKRGTDVNKFVVNLCRDDQVKLAIAKYEHKQRVEAGATNSLEDYLKNDLKISFDSVYEPFAAVHYGDNDKKAVRSKTQKTTDSRFKLGELVTCIIGDSTEPKAKPKSRRRVVKKVVKQEIVEENEAEKKELESLMTSTDQPTTAQRPKRTRKARKALQPIEINYKVEEPEVKLTPVKDESKFRKEIEDILQYSKNSKSALDMDFLNCKEEEATKKPKTRKTKKTPKRMSKFTEYMQWYDERTTKGKDSVASKGRSTTLSTPLKVSLRISQRIAKTKALR